MRKLILKSDLSPGDILMLTAAVRDLHRCYPAEFLTDIRTTCADLWENNPYLTALDPRDPAVTVVECEYPLINRSNQAPYHFVHGFIEHLNETMGLQIRPTEFKGDIHLSDGEKAEVSRVQELTGEDIPYWIIVAGGKFDVTIKWWETERHQAVVDHFGSKIQFVQVGERGHYHPGLKGVIDLRGQTNLRQLVRLVYHAQGVLCGITALMHLAAAVETRDREGFGRPCIVVAGGREPVHWVEYPKHQFIHTVGQLPCCSQGGCWRSRTVALGDGDERDHPDSLCVDVVGKLPRCMHMITPAEVIRRIEGYFEGGSLQYLTGGQATAAARGVARTSSNDFISAHPASRRRSTKNWRSVLIQQASGVYTQMLDLTQHRHASYAARHGFSFWSIRGDAQTDRHPCWNKIVLMHMAFAAGFEFVAWLDADTVIVRPEADLRDALTGGEPLGMCRHPGGWGDPPWHYNSGVMFARNTSAIREFFTRVWNSIPQDHPWHEQLAINEILQQEPGLAQRVDDRWNSTPWANAAADPVIRAWHGKQEKAVNLMKRSLAAINARLAQTNGHDNQNGRPGRNTAAAAGTGS